MTIDIAHPSCDLCATDDATGATQRQAITNNNIFGGAPHSHPIDATS